MHRRLVPILFGNNEPQIRLSATSIAEDASISDIIGTLSVVNGTGVYGFGIDSDPDGVFSITPAEAYLRVGAALDYEDSTSHQVTITSDNGVDPAITRTFTITVTNVLEVTLAALTLDDDTMVEASVEDTVVGALVGVSGGSILSMTDDAGGRFKLSVLNVVAGATATDYDIATTHNITVRETNADGSNSPRDTVIPITITQLGAGPASGTYVGLSCGLTYP
jgi:hypothetical protein